MFRNWRPRFRFIPSISLQTAVTIPLLTIFTTAAFCIAVSPDGSRIVSGSWDHSVRVWDAMTGEQLRELQGHTDTVTSVAFSLDGNRIISGSWDHGVRQSAYLDATLSWAMEQDGWIVSGEHENRLVWVPSTISNVLLRPHNTFTISRRGSATICFEQCRLGPLWHECYRTSK